MKKKILIISTIILVIVIGLIGLFVFYKVQQKEKTVEKSLMKILWCLII